MGLWRRMFPKRERDFFGLLAAQMAKTMEGVELLEKYLHKGNDNSLDQMHRLEHEADDIRRCIIDDLNHTFITPIDRIDIFTLSRALDDIIDHAKTTMSEMEVYDLDPNEYVQMIATNLKHAAQKLSDSVVHFKDRPNLANEDAVRSKLLINNMEHLYHESFKEMADHGDYPYIFKMREIHFSLFKVAEAIRQSNNILLDVIVKMS